MHTAKTYGFALLASSCLLTSCLSSRPGLYNPRIKQFAHDLQKDHENRALGNAIEEQNEPEGFIPANQEFAVSLKNYGDKFMTEKGKIVSGRIKSRIGINIKDSTYFLQGRDFSQPPNAGCNYSATVYLGKYDAQPEELKTMFSEAEAAIATSKRKLAPASDDFLYRAFDSNRVMIYRRLGAGFTQQGLVDLSQKTLAPRICDFQDQASKKAYEDNRRMVEMARTCSNSKNFRADGSFHAFKQ